MASLSGLKSGDFDSISLNGEDITSILKFNSNVSASTQVPSTIGGLNAGTLNSTLQNKTFSQMFDLILFPTQIPNINDANVSLNSLGSYFIVGSTQNFNLTTNVDDGEIFLSGVLQSSTYAGNISSASLTGNIVGNSTVNLNFTGTNDVDDHSVSNYTIALGNNSVTFSVVFLQGPMPIDSTGSNYPSLQFNGGTRTNTRTVVGVYPLFKGNASGATNKDQLNLIAHTSNNIVCAQAFAESNTVRHRLYIPLVMYNLRSWVIQTFNTVSNQYETGNQNIWTITDHTETIEGNSVAYKLYTKTGALSGSNTYRFNF